MKYSQPLDYINNYFEKLSGFQKIEIYLIPIIVALLLMYNFPISKKEPVLNIKTVNQDAYFYEIKKQKILNKINGSHNIKIAKDLQSYAQKIDIKITSFKVTKNNISLETEGSLKSILNFLNFSENYNDITKIENVIITKTDNTNIIKTVLNLSFAQVIRTGINENLENRINNISNPFITKVENPKPKLYAIVNEYVLINNRWLKQNDIFDGYKILKINIDSVELESDANVFKVWLFDEK